MNKKSHLNPIMFAVLLMGGIFIGNNLQFENQKSSYTNNKFNLIIKQLEDIYVDSLDSDKLTELAVEKLLTELDPHSSYIKAKDFENLNEPMEGSFEGIGIEFNLQEDTILVIAPISGGPSEQVGVRAGDKIITVNEKTIAGTGLKNKDVFNLLRGKKGTPVNIGVLRQRNMPLINFNIIRDKIPIHSIDVAYMVNNTLGYIKINRFSKETYDDFITATTDLLNSGMEKIILDLRNNPGGYLGSAIKIANEFLEEGRLIVYTEGKSRAKEEYFSNKRGLLLQTDAVILIDEGSASASEIVAGALQDNDRGIVAGRRSFGKGLVQEQFEHPDGSAFRITTQRYYTPTGRCIQKPYKNGMQKLYESDFLNRIKSGELISKDSIVFFDSLKFTTPKGKIVYGGGGIMPDIFIPIDTSKYNETLAKINSEGVIRDFAFEYTNVHRSELESQSLQEFINLFNINPNILLKLQEKCYDKNIPLNIKTLTENDRKILNIQLKAFIARNIWNDNGFYPVIHELDNTFNKAIKL